MKRKATEWEKITGIYRTEKGLLFRIYKNALKSMRKNHNPTEKWTNAWISPLTKGKLKVAKKTFLNGVQPINK